MPYPEFDLSRLRFDADDTAYPVMTVADLLPLDARVPQSASLKLDDLGTELVKARNQGGATIFLCDAGVVRSGVSLHLIDLMEKRLLTHLCLEPDGVLCDWELASTGRISSTEIQQLASTETIRALLSALADGDSAGAGVGESLGKRINEADFPHERQSLLAQGYRWGVPVTIHAAIGGALLHTADGFDASRVGRMLHRDFLVLANSVENLDDGVVYQFGRPAYAVGVFCVAMKAAQCIELQYQRKLNDFSAAVFGHSSEGMPCDATVNRTAEEDWRHAVAGSFTEIIPALRRGALKFARRDV